mgnify:CR=1 FL=1
MYIEHPYFYEGKYYANIDGEMIEVTKEVAYAMNNFYRSSKAKKVEIKNELGEVVDKMLREVPYSGQSIDGEVFMIEDFPDLNCDVEHCVLTKIGTAGYSQSDQSAELRGTHDYLWHFL